MQYRFDLVFSYWILLWFILYECNFTTYNPKFALLIGLLENTVYLLYMIFYKNSISSIWLFVIINFFIKIVPLYIVANTVIRKRDILFTLCLIFAYIIWLVVNNVNVYQYIKDPLKIFRENKTDETPLISIIKHQIDLNIEKN
jgi:hypothetical protein